LQDNLTWTVGRHALKFGGSGNYGILYRNWDLGLPGFYEFGELSSFNNPVVDPVTGQITYPSSNPNTPVCRRVRPTGLFCRPAMPGVTVLQLNHPGAPIRRHFANIINAGTRISRAIRLFEEPH